MEKKKSLAEEFKEKIEEVRHLPREEFIKALKNTWRRYSTTQKADIIGMLTFAPFSPLALVPFGVAFLGEEWLKEMREKETLQKEVEKLKGIIGK